MLHRYYEPTRHHAPRRYSPQPAGFSLSDGPTAGPPSVGTCFPESLWSPQSELTSPPRRAPPGQSALARHAHPGTEDTRRFQCHVLISAHHQRFTYVHLPHPHL